jgi:hypothetical protein
MRNNLLVILFGLGAIGLGIYEYYDLLALETQGGTRKVHVIIKLLYETLGKLGVLGFFGAVGAICAGVGIVKLVRGTRQDAQAA